MSTHGTQTSPSMPANIHPVDRAAQRPAGSPQVPNGQKQAQPQTAPPKKTARRPASKEYQIQARQRRHQQEFRNYHHPPAPEDIWICEFCEYERIFGTPPEALIRQYEIKDRRVRKQEAERRRLLEKAKMKGRKNKKGNKGSKAAAAAATASAQDKQPQHQQTQQAASMNQSQSQGTQSEEAYYEDEYDEVYAIDDPPPLIPIGKSSAGQHEVVQPDPGKAPTLHNGVGVDNRIAV